MGKRRVHTWIGRVPRANVVAGCSDQAHEISWAKENYADDEIEVYKSYDAMLEQPGLEVVWISSSTDVHASQTLEGIKNGVHVVCEHPLSTDLEENPPSLSILFLLALHRNHRDRGEGNEVQPEYWQRFEDAFALEANEFVESVLKHKPIRLPLETGMMVMEIWGAL